MRYASLSVALLSAAILPAASVPANAATWCLESREGRLCRFSTHDQCMQSATVRGDYCYQDASKPTRPATRTAPAAVAKPQPNSAKPKDPPAKQAAPAAAPAPKPAPQAAATPQDSAAKFAAARNLILTGKYEEGIKAMRALGFDQHPDVAAYVGLAHNKLGRATEARSWYDRALAGNPQHLLTLSYYGMLRAEQGEIEKAQADLETIKSLCGGTSCKEYVALNAVIASKRR